MSNLNVYNANCYNHFVCSCDFNNFFYAARDGHVSRELDISHLSMTTNPTWEIKGWLMIGVSLGAGVKH